MKYTFVYKQVCLKFISLLYRIYPILMFNRSFEITTVLMVRNRVIENLSYENTAGKQLIRWGLTGTLPVFFT